MLAPFLFVTDSFSLVDVVCDVVFLIRIVNLSSRRLVSLQKKREASVALQCETDEH